MSATTFRLARLLRLRAQVRQLRQHEADELAAGLVALEEQARTLAAERERQGAAEAAAAAAGALTPATLQLGREYDLALAAREQALATAVAEQRAALATKREELAHEHREERKFQHLEEAHRQRVSEEEGRHTDRLLDELAAQAHGRGRKDRHDGER